ncbi:MAG: M48 family metalloprotease [Gloeobacteraceae cyanobacterium ES-bin-316]|nr:M48 family metalloprotease [Ferruginibacter sp.]
MKKLFFAIGLFLFGQIVSAQKINQCGFVIPPASTLSNFQSVYEAGTYVNRMLDSINWQENFNIREQAGINNAYATIIRNQRYIVYDNSFLENLDSYAKTRWASLSVMAHEMGHHYRNHLVDSRGSTPAKEIEADYFSGYVMAKMGAGLNEAMAAMQSIASERGSTTHPAKASRLTAISQGWNYAKGLNQPGKNPNTSPAPQPQQNPPPPANDASWIYLSLYGNNEMTVYLSDDNKTFTPVPLKTTQPFVFKFEIYNYGWLRFSNTANAKKFQLLHGKDYAIIWSRRTNSWVVTVVP